MKTPKANDDRVFQRMDALMVVNNIRQKDLMDYLGTSKSTYSSWKSSVSTSYYFYLGKICEFLHTTPNYLIYGTEDSAVRSNEDQTYSDLRRQHGMLSDFTDAELEDRLLRIFRSLKPVRRMHLVSIAEMMLVE